MSGDREERCSVLTCKYCGANIGPKPDTIKNALKRLKMYPGEKNGKNSKVKQSKREKATELC